MPDTTTFLFTDIEGSTRLWEREPDLMRDALAKHDRVLRDCIERHNGQVFKTVGDAFCAAFRHPTDAVCASSEAQRQLRQQVPDLKVRMAIYTGSAEHRDNDYFGPALNRVSRLLSAGHGGQVLIANSVVECLRQPLPDGSQIRSLGTHRLRDITYAESIFQLQPTELPDRFPPLNTLEMAYRRGFRRALAIGASVALVVGSLAAFASLQWQRADKATRQEQIQRRQAQQNLYAALINLAGQAWAANNPQRVRQLVIDAQASSPENVRRHFEWRLCRFLAGGGKAQRDASVLEGHKARVACVTFSPDSRILVSASIDRTACLWDVRSGRRLRVLTAGQRLVAAKFARDGSWLALAGEDGSIELWDPYNGSRMARLTGHNGVVWWLALSKDGRTLASCSADGTARLWDVPGRKTIRLLRGHIGVVRCIDFAPDGKCVATGGDDRTIRLWDTRTGKQTNALSGHDEALWMVRFSPDGHLLASGSGDGSLRLWDTLAWKELTGLKAHRELVNCLAFSADGSRLATASGDGAVKLWDVATRQELLTLPEADHHSVTDVEFSPDGQSLVSGTDNGRVELWRAPMGAGPR